MLNGQARVAATDLATGHFILALFISTMLPGWAISQEIQSGTITAVTVYPGIANVERTVALPQGSSGSRILQLGPLPASLRDRSIRVTAEGELQVLSVKVRRSSGDPVEPQRLRDLRSQIEEARQSLQILERQDQTLASHQNRYEGMVPEKPKAKVSIPLSQEAWRGLSELILSGMKNATNQRILLAPKILQAKTVLQQLNRELEKFENDAERKTAVIEIEAADTTGDGGVFRVEYQVPGATWKPSYEAHVQEDLKLIDLRIYAEVRQWTGEDWPAVPMSFSTSLPESGAEPGILAALKIERPRFFQPAPAKSPVVEPLPESSLVYKESPKQKPGKFNRPRKRVEPPVLGGLSLDKGGKLLYWYDENDAVQEKLDDRGFLTVFEAIHAEPVASNGSPHRRLFSLDSVAFEAFHRCVPELETAVFRRLKMVLGGQEPLLAGPVSVFVADDYLGMSRIETTVAPGEEWSIDLGTLDQLVVNRTTEESEETRGLLSRVIEYQTETILKLENYGSSSETIVILERIPVSDDELVTIEMDPDKTDPKPLDLKPSDGIMRWDVSVEPGQSKTVRFVWTMQIPKDKILLRREAPERMGGE